MITHYNINKLLRDPDTGQIILDVGEGYDKGQGHGEITDLRNSFHEMKMSKMQRNKIDLIST